MCCRKWIIKQHEREKKKEGEEGGGGWADDTPSRRDIATIDFWKVDGDSSAGRLIELREPETEEESFLGRIQSGN